MHLLHFYSIDTFEKAFNKARKKKNTIQHQKLFKRLIFECNVFNTIGVSNDTPLLQHYSAVTKGKRLSYYQSLSTTLIAGVMSRETLEYFFSFFFSRALRLRLRKLTDHWEVNMWLQAPFYNKFGLDFVSLTTVQPLTS